MTVKQLIASFDPNNDLVDLSTRIQIFLSKYSYGLFIYRNIMWYYEESSIKYKRRL